MTVNKERMELWASALEANGDKQCMNALTEIDENGVRLHCALGIGMAVAEINGVVVTYSDWEQSNMSPAVVEWYGLEDRDPKLVIPEQPDKKMTVMLANDEQKLPFFTIAQMLRAKYIKDES